LFFPESDPLVGTLQAFGIYAVGFVARPAGAAIFGHFGDRIGRKATLIITLLLMGLSTFFVALVPGYATIGIWGAIILTMLRFLQGVGLGGEMGRSHIDRDGMGQDQRPSRVHYFLAAVGRSRRTVLRQPRRLGVQRAVRRPFLAWGWRIPFFLSLLLVAVGLYIRLSILETPVFARLVKEERVARAPAIEVFRSHPKEIALTALCRMAEQGPFYIYAAFVFTYGIGVLHASRNFILTAVLAAALLSLVTTPLAGHLSDVIGRKRWYLIGAVATGIVAFIYFAMMNTALPAVMFVAIVLSFVPHDMMWGSQAALISECFPARLRYSGSSIGFHLARSSPAVQPR